MSVNKKKDQLVTDRGSKLPPSATLRRRSLVAIDVTPDLVLVAQVDDLNTDTFEQIFRKAPISLVSFESIGIPGCKRNLALVGLPVGLIHGKQAPRYDKWLSQASQIIVDQMCTESKDKVLCFHGTRNSYQIACLPDLVSKARSFFLKVEQPQGMGIHPTVQYLETIVTLQVDDYLKCAPVKFKVVEDKIFDIISSDLKSWYAAWSYQDEELEVFISESSISNHLTVCWATEHFVTRSLVPYYALKLNILNPDGLDDSEDAVKYRALQRADIEAVTDIATLVWEAWKKVDLGTMRVM